MSVMLVAGTVLQGGVPKTPFPPDPSSEGGRDETLSVVTDFGRLFFLLHIGLYL